jgi:hypothetical protein
MGIDSICSAANQALQIESADQPASQKYYFVRHIPHICGDPICPEQKK